MKPLIILTGPTAVGKTELSIRLAKAVNDLGELVLEDNNKREIVLTIGDII